jgi:adenosylhomocysteine nucleosidase
MTDRTDAPVVVVAMPSELRHALEATSRHQRADMGPWTRWRVDLDGATLDLVLSGIGMVNAGAALSRAIAELSPTVVLNYGCAGAHKSDMHPGDVVVGTSYVHHRAVTILPSGEERHGGSPVSPRDSTLFMQRFDADEMLLGAARSAAENWRPKPWPFTPEAQPSVHWGPLTSADAWTQATTLISQIHSEHGTFCEDMEAAALAQICFMHQLPFLAIKDISNNEFHSATDHGETGGPSLDDVAGEVGSRAFELLKRTFS